MRLIFRRLKPIHRRSTINRTRRFGVLYEVTSRPNLPSKRSRDAIDLMRPEIENEEVSDAFCF